MIKELELQFMGTAPPSGKNQRQGFKVLLWAALTCLSLLTGVVVGSPSPEVRLLDASLGDQPTASDTDSMDITNPGLLEPGAEDSIEVSLGDTWSPLYADNGTLNGHSNADFGDDLLLRAERSPIDLTKSKTKPSKKSNRGGRGCRIRSLMVKVRDLGLGYISDEIVPFKYCSGACHRSRTNYDLTLSHLLKQKAISGGPPDKVSSHPCCRPTKYEPVSFMDVKSMWHTVDKLSAAECSCVG
ncbi:artemin [Ambystoma mexicanum]|uniref:artemin n=1 Tax=Ambystoma mexicanum TaxID=8296 RepID=UPI0037E733D6